MVVFERSRANTARPAGRNAHDTCAPLQKPLLWAYHLPLFQVLLEENRVISSSRLSHAWQAYKAHAA